MIKFAEISDNIISSFEGGNSDLPVARRLHWYLRRFRTTGNQKYIPEVALWFNKSLPRIIRCLELFSDKSKIDKHCKSAVSGYEPSNPRRKRRLLYYQKNPEVILYIETILYLFLIKSLGLEKTGNLAELYNRAVDYLKSRDIYKYFLELDLIKAYPSECANIVYNSAFLGIFDKRKELLEKSENYWLQVINPADNSVWLDKIYALTHLIIAASDYYQKFVNKKEFSWILDYFERDYRQIIKNVSPDCVGEMALCFKLAGDFSNPVIVKVQKFLAAKFDKSLGYIPRESGNSLSTAEHRNVVATMIFTDFKTLYSGPDLSKVSSVE